MATAVLISNQWNDGGPSISASQNINAANLYELDEPVIVLAGGVKHDFGIPVPANIVAVIVLVTGNLPGVSAYTLTTWAELSGAQATTLDTLALLDNIPRIWAAGQGVCPLQLITAVLSSKLVNGIANSNTARLQLRVACS